MKQHQNKSLILFNICIDDLNKKLEPTIKISFWDIWRQMFEFVLVCLRFYHNQFLSFISSVFNTICQISSAETKVMIFRGKEPVTRKH